jgi:hypothetical protein
METLHLLFLEVMAVLQLEQLQQRKMNTLGGRDT